MLDLVIERLRDRVSHADLLARAFAEWLGVFDLGASPVGSFGLWEPREVAAAGLRESRGLRATRSFLEGLHWLRSREYFRAHVPQVFEADPFAILAVALAIKGINNDGAVAWIRDIAKRAALAESDPWRLSLLEAAAGGAPATPELAVALGLTSDKEICAEARETSLLLDDVPTERAAVRLAVLTRASDKGGREVPTQVNGSGAQGYQGVQNSKPAFASRHLVISLHGIRTRGTWQKDLTRSLNEGGFNHEPLDFGFFRAIQLIMPRARRSRAEWFREEYTRVSSHLTEPPSIIAHSFGTYLVTRALAMYPEIRFRRIILCGSIVSVDYPWSTIIKKQQQVEQVLNEHGHQDFWAGIVAWGVADAGPSGVIGFEDLAGGAVVQRSHPEFRHSDYFYKLNYEHTWVPFLKGIAPAQHSNVPARRNIRFLIALFVLFLCVIATLIGVFSSWNKSNHADVTPRSNDTSEASRTPSVKLRLQGDPRTRLIIGEIFKGPMGDSEFDINLPLGRIPLIAEAPGCESITRVLDLREDKTLSLSLNPAAGWVSLFAGPFATCADLQATALPPVRRTFQVSTVCNFAIPREVRDSLIQHACWLSRNSDARVSIAGHTASIGSREYNLGLGERLGNAALSFFGSHGDAEGRIGVVSYGEERPIFQTEDYLMDMKNERITLEYETPVPLRDIGFAASRCDVILDQVALDYNIGMLREHRSIVVTIEGHASSREAEPLELSLCRARHVYSKLVDNSLAPDRIRLVEGLGSDALGEARVVMVSEWDRSRSDEL